MAQVFTSVSGKTVTIRTVIEPSDIILTGSDRWGVLISSKTDRGLGSTGVPDYPYYIDYIQGNGSYTFTKTLIADKYVAEIAIPGQGPVDFSLFEIVPIIEVPKATIFNWCWKVGLGTGTCNIPPSMPVVTAGSSVTIQADIANSGVTGKVRGVIKIDGSQIASQDNASLATFPTGPLWSIRTTYTMPNKDVTLTTEAYGWDGSTWILTDTKTSTISMTAPGCTGISLDPFSATLDPTSTTNNKVTLTATVTPFGIGGSSFPVTFKDDAGAVLGTCNTNVTTGKCTYIFDSIGRTAGTYRVTAYSGTTCYSTTTSIVVSQPILQWNFVITVIDSTTGLSIQGATILVATAGKASQSKLTGSDGTASFRLDEGTVSISINKSGYNTFNTAEYMFRDLTKIYTITITPSVPTTGDVQFVSVPSNAEIFIDGITTTQKTPMTVTDIPAGSHKWMLKLVGYNDSNGNVTVPSGGSASVYVTMTPVTPTMGSLNITSHPVMDAEVWIDGKDTGLATSGLTIVTDIPPGQHSYKVTLSGYKDATGKFNVTAGQTTTLDVEMIPIATIGTLEMTSEPSGARVWIDEKDTGRITPATIVNLTEGDHKYKIVLSGYKDISGIVSIIPGGTKAVHLILEKSGAGLEVWAGVAIAGVAVLSFLKSSGEKK